MPDDPYCYPGTSVLINLLDVRVADSLRDLEHGLTMELAPSALAFATAELNLKFSTLQGIHRLLFGDLYSWAGEVRTVVIARSSFQFMPPPILGEIVGQTVIEPFHHFARTSELTAEALARELGKVC